MTIERPIKPEQLSPRNWPEPPKYTDGNQIVKALKVKEVERVQPTPEEIEFRKGDVSPDWRKALVAIEEKGDPIMIIHESELHAYEPKPGDFLLINSKGERSFCPASTFRLSYTRII